MTTLYEVFLYPINREYSFSQSDSSFICAKCPPDYMKITESELVDVLCDLPIGLDIYFMIEIRKLSSVKENGKTKIEKSLILRSSLMNPSLTFQLDIYEFRKQFLNKIN